MLQVFLDEMWPVLQTSCDTLRPSDASSHPGASEVQVLWESLLYLLFLVCVNVRVLWQVEVRLSECFMLITWAVWRDATKLAMAKGKTAKMLDVRALCLTQKRS